MSTTAYLSDPQLKERFVAELAKHREADRLVQGTYGVATASRGWRGCAVACSLRSLDILAGQKRLKTTYDDHRRFEAELGIPEWLARLEDRIFEGLPMDEAMAWPGRFAAAIPVGADLAPIMHRFGAWLMRENLERVQALALDEPLKTQVLDAIRGVLTLHETSASASRSAAESAAESAARSAAWSAAESAARSAAWSAASAAWSAASAARSAAESAAWSAAESAAESAAWSAARSAAYHDQAEMLLAMLAEATP